MNLNLEDNKSRQLKYCSFVQITHPLKVEKNTFLQHPNWCLDLLPIEIDNKICIHTLQDVNLSIFPSIFLNSTEDSPREGRRFETPSRVFVYIP